MNLVFEPVGSGSGIGDGCTDAILAHTDGFHPAGLQDFFHFTGGPPVLLELNNDSGTQAGSQPGIMVHKAEGRINRQAFCLGAVHQGDAPEDGFHPRLDHLHGKS